MRGDPEARAHRATTRGRSGESCAVWCGAVPSPPISLTESLALSSTGDRKHWICRQEPGTNDAYAKKFVSGNRSAADAPSERSASGTLNASSFSRLPSRFRERPRPRLEVRRRIRLEVSTAMAGNSCRPRIPGDRGHTATLREPSRLRERPDTHHNHGRSQGWLASSVLQWS